MRSSRGPRDVVLPVWGGITRVCWTRTMCDNVCLLPAVILNVYNVVVTIMDLWGPFNSHDQLPVSVISRLCLYLSQFSV